MNLEMIRQAIGRLGIAERDRHDLPSSDQTFADGAHFRNEISGIGIGDLEALVDEQKKLKVPIHRVIMGAGDRMTRSELRAIAQIANENRFEVIMDPGPKSITDIGRHAETSFGRWGGWRVRGADNVAYLIREIVRCREEGIRGFLLFDEGVLMVLNKLRAAGEIPQDVIFKMSYTAGYRNPAGAALLQELGADSFNPVTDLDLAMLAAIRQTVRIPMDIVVFGWDTLGNFSRIHETPEIVRVAAPCYLKQELTGDPRRKVKYCEMIWETIHENQPEIRVSECRPDDLMIPIA